MYWVETSFEKLPELKLGTYLRVSPKRPEKGAWHEIEGEIIRKETSTEGSETEYTVLVMRFENGFEHDLMLHPQFGTHEIHYDLRMK